MLTYVLGTSKKQKNAKASVRGLRVVVLSLMLINRLKETEPVVFKFCRFSISERSVYKIIACVIES